MSLAVDADGQMRWLPAKFLHRPADGPATWRECRVRGYDSARRRFDVSYSADGAANGAGESASVSRIDLCFAAEDPFVFAKRVAAAHAARHAATDAIRYQLLIESMPSEELPPLEKVGEHPRR